MAEPRKLKRAVIREELVALAGDMISGVLLGQFLYWHERTKDTDKYIMEEAERMSALDEDPRLLPTYGWIYKTANDILEETMLGCSERTVNRSLDLLVTHGWVQRRNNPKYHWDHTYQYRVDLCLIQEGLSLIGYELQGYVFDDVSKRHCVASERSADATIPEITIETTSEKRDVAIATPCSFQDWLELLKTNKNVTGTLRRMFTVLYPDATAPSFPYLGKVAKQVGGSSRLAQLMWEHSTRPPVGDVLAFMIAVNKNKKAEEPAPQKPYKDPARIFNPITDKWEEL